MMTSRHVKFKLIFVVHKSSYLSIFGLDECRLLYVLVQSFQSYIYFLIDVVIPLFFVSDYLLHLVIPSAMYCLTV